MCLQVMSPGNPQTRLNGSSLTMLNETTVTEIKLPMPTSKLSMPMKNGLNERDRKHAKPNLRQLGL